MPLSKVQTQILRLLASHRDPESYIAGASALNRDAARYSNDRLVTYETHVGQARGHWPTSASIAAAMLARYNISR